MRKAKLLLPIFLLAISHYSLGDMSYTYLSLGYADGEVWAQGADGFEFAGSYAINNRLHLLAEYQPMEFQEDNLTASNKVDTKILGLGWHTPLSGSTDFIVTGAFIDFDSDVFESGSYRMLTAVRGMLGRKFEYFLSLDYVDIKSNSDDDGGLEAGIRYFTTPKTSFGLAARNTDIREVVRLDFRYDF